MALPAPLSPARGPENGEALGRLGISLQRIRLFQPTKGQLPGCLCWSRAALALLSQGSRTEHAHSDPALLEGTCWLGWSPPCLPSVAGAVGRMGAGYLPQAVSLEPVECGQELVGAREAPSTSLTAPGPARSQGAVSSPGACQAPALQPSASWCTQSPHTHPLSPLLATVKSGSSFSCKLSSGHEILLGLSLGDEKLSNT